MACSSNRRAALRNKVLTKLHQVQSLIARKIIRAYKTVSFDASTVLADIIPIELYANKWATLFAIKHFELISSNMANTHVTYLSHSECLMNLLSENNIEPVEYSEQSHQCHQNPAIITYPTTIIKSQEEAIQTALNHHLSDNDTNSTFHTDAQKLKKMQHTAKPKINMLLKVTKSN